MQCGTDMQCGGTQTRRQQERRGTPKPGRGAAGGASVSERSPPRAPVSGCPAPLLPSPGLRSDPAQCNKSSPKVTLTQTIPKSSLLGIVWVSMTFGELLGIAWVSMTFGER